jgi:hypothetical protein
MKATLIGILILIIVAVAGVWGYSTFGAKQTAAPSVRTTAPVTKSGTVRKAVPPGDDYTHFLMSADGTTKLNSYSVKLDQYEGQQVTATGQYSGNTLYVDTVTK